MKATRCFTLTLLTFVILAFVPNSFAQEDSSELVVQVIYFHPNDREPQADIETVLDTLMKDVQQFYADEMERHGFGRKTFVSPPNTIRLQFEIFGSELHQAQLLTNSFSWRGTRYFDPTTLLDCKLLNANSPGVEIVPPGQPESGPFQYLTRVEFVTTELLPATEYVTLRVIGNNHQHISFGSRRFPIDVTSLLPRSEPVLIPDKNLAALIRKNLGLPSKRPITKLDMLGFGTIRLAMQVRSENSQILDI